MTGCLERARAHYLSCHFERLLYKFTSLTLGGIYCYCLLIRAFMNKTCLNERAWFVGIEDGAINPFTAMASFKHDQLKCEIGNPLSLFSSFSLWRVKGFSSKLTALKVDVIQARKMYCLQARPCIFQPGNFTGWGSEGVKPHPTGNGLENSSGWNPPSKEWG